MKKEPEDCILDAELKRGKGLAKKLVLHLNRMGADKAKIPIKLFDKEYLVVVEPKSNNCDKYFEDKKCNEGVKPVINLSGSDKGTTGLMQQVDKALQNAGMKDKADKFILEARKSISYDKLLRLCGEYVTIR